MAIIDGYTTLAEVKAILRITDDVDDSLLETCVEAASRQIESHTERVFLPTTATRLFTPEDSYYVSIDDLSTLTSLKTSSAAVEIPKGKEQEEETALTLALILRSGILTLRNFRMV